MTPRTQNSLWLLQGSRSKWGWGWWVIILHCHQGNRSGPTPSFHGWVAPSLWETDPGQMSHRPGVRYSRWIRTTEDNSIPVPTCPMQRRWEQCIVLNSIVRLCINIYFLSSHRVECNKFLIYPYIILNKGSHLLFNN